MVLSKLIAKLARMMLEHGDLPVFVKIDEATSVGFEEEDITLETPESKSWVQIDADFYARRD